MSIVVAKEALFLLVLSTASGTWGEGAAVLMETSSSSAMVAAASGLCQETQWESMRLPVRRRQYSIVIPSESARAAQV